MVDLEQYVEGQVGLEVGCPDFSSHCAQLPCTHGVCSERSVGRYCDCSVTEFTGRDCDTSAQFVGFSGEDYLRFFISQSNTTQTNDVSLRFKGLQENSFLFSLSNRQTGQFLRAVLYDGKNIKIETNIGGNKTLLLRCDPLNDNQWHTLRLKRRPGYLQAFVDNCYDSDTSVNSGGSSYSFAVNEILIGRSGQSFITGKSGQSDDAFIGYLQNFNVDEYQFFEVLKLESSSQFPRVTFNSTVRLTSEEAELFAFPVTFTRQAYTNVTLMELRVHENRALRLVLRTSEQDGLIIYNRGLLRDHFFAVELVGGILQVSANDAGVAQVVRATGAQLSDGRWHTVDIRETAPKQFAIVVDKTQTFQLRLPSTQNSLDLLGSFHVGGAPDSVLQQLPAVVRSRKGFTGCLATLIIDGKLIDMSKDPGDQADQSPYIFKGCMNDTTKFCQVHPCHNGGLCFDEVDSFRCDCKLTSFVGRYCNAEAEGYQFGLEGGSGLVAFNVTSRENVVNDALALGFETRSDNGTLLFLRSSSSSSSSQFFEIRLVYGFLSIRYDFGSGIQELVERGRKFNDGEYHHLSFQKNGSNFQLQVDDMPVQRYNLQGSSSEFFSSLYFVELGARGRDAKGIIVNPFGGIISGVFVNGYEITDLGVNQKDTRVNVFGDTVIASHPFFVAETRPEVLPTKPAVIIGGGVGWVSESSIIDEIVFVPGADGGNALAQSQEGAGYSRAEEGGRAAAISGAMLALLAVVSSMMWAVYRCKPGIVGKVVAEFDCDTGAGTSMLYTARKSLSSAGADDVTVSQSTPGYESWNAVSSDTTGRKPSRTSISHEMALFPTSGSQASNRMYMESSSREVKSGGFMETAGFGQGASQVTAGRNVSTQIIVERSSAGNTGGTGHGQEMSQITMSSHKASTQIGGGHSGLAQDGAQDMTLNSNYINFGGAGQDMSQFTSGQNVSTQMFSQSGSTGNLGGTGLGHEMSQGATYSRKGSTQMIVETSTGGRTDLGQEMSYVSMDRRNMSSQMVHGSGSTASLGRNLLGQDISQVTTSTRKGSTELLFDASSDGYAGGTSIQERSQVTTFSQNQKGSTQLLFDANSGGYAGGNSIQERSQVTAFSQKGSAQMIVDANSGGYAGGTSIQERSQVTTFSQKGSAQMIVGTNTVGNVGVTGRGQDVSQAAMSGYNSSVQMVDASKTSMSQVPSMTITVAGHGAALAQGMDIDAKSAERKEETIHLSGKKRLDGRNLSPTEPHATKTMGSVENSTSSIQGQAFKASEIRVQDRGFTVNTSSTVTTEHVGFGLSSDRKVPLIKGQPPKTLKLETSAREGGSQFSPEMGDLKVNVSLERSNSSVRGQPPKTLNLGSPTVQHGGADFSVSGDLRAPRSLERSSSFVQGEQPKTLKIESPVNASSGVTSPTVWGAATGSPFSPRHQPSSAFTETRQSTGRAIRSETFTTSQGVPSNPQLPNLSMTSRTYQMRNVPLNVSEEELYKYKIPGAGVPHWQLHSALAGLNEPTNVTAGPPPMTSETTDRVECILLTANGQSLITGSVYGPPQVWDMKTGECLKKMEGDNMSSTDLHLASNDTLLIGQVAEVQHSNPPNTAPDGQNFKRLQIWDFDSGRCLKMRNNEQYTASFLMSDEKHVILSRREAAAGGASSSVVIVVWDILGNQPDRRISYSLARNVPTDHITYISQTPDKRFVVAGFRNPNNGNATYLAFDLTVSNFDVVPPTMIELAADVQVTIIVENHEAVTGTKSGTLVVWSLRTGKQQRQLVAPSAEVASGRAHQMDVKDLVVSKDGQHLVSASADCTLRLWNLALGKHLRTFTGHTDMVSCCAISNDNELVVSGSRDQTIRLWRLDNGMLVTSIFISADVYRVLLSNDKKTIAALADQDGARKMVMLQVVRTKTKRRMGSHGESPESPDSPFTPSFQLTPETG